METGSLFSVILYPLPLLVPAHLESDAGGCSMLVPTTYIAGSSTYEGFLTVN